MKDVEKFPLEDEAYAREYLTTLRESGMPYSLEKDDKGVSVFVDWDARDRATNTPIMVGGMYQRADVERNEPTNVTVTRIYEKDWGSLYVEYRDDNGNDHETSIRQFTYHYSADPQKRRKQIKREDFADAIFENLGVIIGVVIAVGVLVLGIAAFIKYGDDWLDETSGTSLGAPMTEEATGSFSCTVLDKRLATSDNSPTGYIVSLKDDDGLVKTFYVPMNVYEDADVSKKVVVNYSSTKQKTDYMFGVYESIDVKWQIGDSEVYPIEDYLER